MENITIVIPVKIKINGRGTGKTSGNCKNRSSWYWEYSN